MKKLNTILYPFIVIVILLLIWFIGSLIIGVDLILPTPYSAFKELCIYFSEKELYIALSSTIMRSLLSLLISFVMAFILAVVSKLNKKSFKLISPFISIMRLIPTMSIILILILWMSPNVTPIIVAMIVLLPTFYTAILQSLNMVDDKLIEMALIYKASSKKKLKYLYIPIIKKPLLDTFSSGIGLSFKLVIASEALALSRNSIGNLMQNNKIWLETEKLFALAILSIIAGLILESVIKYIGKRVLKID